MPLDDSPGLAHAFGLLAGFGLGPTGTNPQPALGPKQTARALGDAEMKEAAN